MYSADLSEQIEFLDTAYCPHRPNKCPPVGVASIRSSDDKNPRLIIDLAGILGSSTGYLSINNSNYTRSPDHFTAVRL